MLASLILHVAGQVIGWTFVESPPNIRQMKNTPVYLMQVAQLKGLLA
ncbi:hypothetical protein OYT1_ch2038 [Ferriphaselus amnicola]|uniref:Uncharacterized protein n=1 Tax=Ferriphaselus amnicola TaxID=1188319 RepID=A0A2Z6GE57_9PROT|nr:hypothetical protein OYT1_ch2038 [Ferriphaselus amnicola]